MRKSVAMVKIMIVEDDPNIALITEMTLSRKDDFTIVKCTNGEEALERIEEEQPNLVLLDIMMPGIDGYEVCRQIKSSPKTKFISVILLSAKRELQDKLKGMELGADDYIVKPFNPDELLSRVKAQLRIRELEKELMDKKKLETVVGMSVTLQHQINNPLAAILGNADILSGWRSLSEKDIDECTRVIIEQSKRIRDLVLKMSHATKITESRYVGDMKMFEVEQSDQPDPKK